MVIPDRVGDHLVLVASDVGHRALINQIEDHGDVGPGSRLAQAVGDCAAYVLGKRDAKLCGLGLRPPLQLGVHGDLCACIHDGAIMPSLSFQRKTRNCARAELWAAT